MKNFIRQHKSKLKFTTAFIAVALAVVIVASSALAFFKYEVADDTSLTTMNTDILLVQDSITSDSIVYSVQPTSNNTDFVYTRVVIFPIIEIQDAINSNTYHTYAGIPTSNVNYTVTGTNWSYHDGYYYYQYQIDSGINVENAVNKATSQLTIGNISLDTKSYDESSKEWFELPTKVDGKNIRVRFYVSAEAVQAKNNAYQLNWDLTETTFKNTIGIKDLNTIYNNADGIKTNMNAKEDADMINNNAK